MKKQKFQSFKHSWYVNRGATLDSNRLLEYICNSKRSFLSSKCSGVGFVSSPKHRHRGMTMRSEQERTPKGRFSDCMVLTTSASHLENKNRENKRRGSDWEGETVIGFSLCFLSGFTFPHIEISLN